ncbi:MAG: LPXTG cell wall anchor domain-containing protein [Clostridiales bacterium]|nr:LPXTG cell wall anchor domain-containing protein [Clostridiales bacterium]
MNRKIVALLLAVMLVASSVAAFAASTQYIITNDGVIIYNPNDGTTETVNLKTVHADSIDEAKAILTAQGYTKIKLLDSKTDNVDDSYHWTPNTFLVQATDKDGNEKFFTVQITAEHDKGDNLGTDTSGLPTSGTDSFNHYYTNFDSFDLIENVTFDAKAFGNGVTFDHSAAKKLFTIKVKADATALITIKDDEGRLYPVAGASWNAAANAYALNLAKGEHTISWFGTDGAGYHANGKASDPKTMELRVSMKVASVEKFMNGASETTGNVEIRFDYTVRHGDAHHVAAGSASAPKTGDAGMAYMTLAALIVMMGAAVVVTRKVRNF